LTADAKVLHWVDELAATLAAETVDEKELWWVACWVATLAVGWEWTWGDSKADVMARLLVAQRGSELVV